MDARMLSSRRRRRPLMHICHCPAREAEISCFRHPACQCSLQGWNPTLRPGRNWPQTLSRQPPDHDRALGLDVPSSRNHMNRTLLLMVPKLKTLLRPLATIRYAFIGQLVFMSTSPMPRLLPATPSSQVAAEVGQAVGSTAHTWRGNAGRNPSATSKQERHEEAEAGTRL